MQYQFNLIQQLVLSKLLDQDAPILKDKHPITAAITSKCFGFLFFIWPFINMILPPKNFERNGMKAVKSIAVGEKEKEHPFNNLFCKYF